MIVASGIAWVFLKALLNVTGPGVRYRSFLSWVNTNPHLVQIPVKPLLIFNFAIFLKRYAIENLLLNFFIDVSKLIRKDPKR